jgi:hypothetical protein
MRNGSFWFRPRVIRIGIRTRPPFEILERTYIFSTVSRCWRIGGSIFISGRNWRILFKRRVVIGIGMRTRPLFETIERTNVFSERFGRSGRSSSRKLEAAR